ncbi:PIG-L deacetylase family protein [Microbacterium sp. NC79]|uniref:PIG-L deacetylase family protein n=1 Tax=Microbacterium sp. NC79 TaxID=2851009 RepID=UPI001C2C3CA8|nr:PIG-L family deacetylase [Microbacterium sp. NC79]MBV0896226.1 PIG-L family deacetylase [Microbacterium sp. NC79]
MNVVVVIAHQDDEMRCLGTLLRYRDEGHRVAIVCVTNGNRGLPFTDESTLADVAAVRDREMRSVCAVIGADYHCLDRGDGAAVADLELRNQLVGVLRTLEADVVFTHWTSDYNPDHVATARAVIDAALFTSLGSFAPGTAPLRRPPGIFHMSPGDGYGYEATHFVPLTEAISTEKSRLIRLHVSQMGVLKHMRGRDYADDVAEEDRRNGARMLVDAAEAFRPCLSERRIPWPDSLPGSEVER